MTARGRTVARWAFVVYVTFVAWRILPHPAFVILAVIVLVASAFVLAGTWYERAVDVETENVTLRFAVEALEVDNAELAREHEALLDRLSEVLDEHALCPVPIEPEVENVSVATTLKIVGGKAEAIPRQRNGGRS